MRTFLLCLLAAGATAGSPGEEDHLNEVVMRLQEITDTAFAESKKEAELYDKAACMCKDTQKELMDKSTDTASKNAEARAGVEKAKADYETASKDYSNAQKAAEASAAKLKKLREAREEAMATFERRKADTESFLDIFEKTLAEAKSGQLTADGIMQKAQAKETLETRFQTGKTQQMSAIIEEIQKIIDEQKDALLQLKKTHIEDKKNKDMEINTEQNTLETEQRNMAEAEKARASAEKDLSEQQMRASQMTSEYLVAQEALQMSVKQCKEEKEVWDEKFKTMGEEIEVLSQVAAILRKEVAESQASIAKHEANKDAAQTKYGADKDLHKHTGGTQGKSFVSTEVVPDVANEDQLEIIGDAPSMSFMQVRMLTKNPVERAVDVLESAAKRFSDMGPILGAMQTAASSRAGADPFREVKDLIQNLLEKMRAQQEQEESDFEECSSSLSKLTNQYNSLTSEVDETSASYRKAGATVYQLKVDHADYNDQLTKAQGELQRASDLRDAEKTANTEIIKSAESGKKAIEKAIEIVQGFLDKKKEKRGRAAKNVKSMLEVIGTDFDISKAEAQKAEEQQAADFLEYQTEMKSQINVLEKNLESTTASLSDKVSEANSLLNTMKTKRTESLSVLDELVTTNSGAACKPKGQMTYAERKQARRDEIKALKEALEIIGEA